MKPIKISPNSEAQEYETISSIVKSPEVSFPGKEVFIGVYDNFSFS